MSYHVVAHRGVHREELLLEMSRARVHRSHTLSSTPLHHKEGSEHCSLLLLLLPIPPRLLLPHFVHPVV